MPLSALEPFVQAGLYDLNSSGFFLDTDASDLTIACVTSLIVGDVEGNHSRKVKVVLPRAKLVKCTKLVVDLELWCGLTEKDVNTCLIHLSPPKPLYAQSE